MCGASVIVSLHRENPDPAAQTAEAVNKKDRLAKSLDLIKHRGPDAHGIWVDPTATVGLGHCRLSIIDLSDEGNQPLHDDQNHVHAVINGEIYDHERLREECINAGYKFKGKSDSEIVVALYQRYGAPEFLEHCRGEFSMVIYDDQSGEIFAARDRLGIKPLYWTIVQNELFFASEIKAFLGLGWKPEWDVVSIALGRALWGPHTLFKGVNRIEPGYYMKVTREGAISHAKYWEIEFPDKTKVDNRSMDEMVEQLREQLVEAVRLRLRADVPIGIYLSGGLDSSMVAGIAKHLVDKEGVAMGSDIASRTAEYLGVRNIKLKADEELLSSYFEEAIWHTEQPTLSNSFGAKIALAKLTRENGIKVILTGEGADETFAGYPWILPDYLLEPDYSRPDAQINQHHKELSKPASEQAVEAWSKYCYPRLGEDIQTASPEILSRFRNTKTIFYHGSGSGETLVEEKLQQKYDIDQKLQARLDTISPDIQDKMRNKWHTLNVSLYQNKNIEGRPPILDHKVIEFAAALPPSVKLGYFPQGAGLDSGLSAMRLAGNETVASKFREKWILCEAAKPFVTEEVYSRPKHGFMASNVYPKGGPMHRLLARLLTKEKVDAVGFLDWPKIQAYFDLAFEGKDTSGSYFTYCITAATFVILSQRFGVATAVIH
ncbi:asparagine synthase [Colletotrichum eremochloae]|nr:asparagine synthase [Colletotrichum eremochloae]